MRFVHASLLLLALFLLLIGLVTMWIVLARLNPVVPPAEAITPYLREQPGAEKQALNTTQVPRTVWMTYYDKSKVPEHIHANLAKFAPEYAVHLWDDADIEDFLAGHFVPEVLRRFRSMPRGCFKADLFRMAVLYVHGGIYLDVKTMLVRPLREVFAPHGLTATRGHKYPEEGYHIGVLSTPPRHPVLARAFCAVMATTDFMLLLRYHMHCVAFGVAVRDWEALHPQEVKTLSESCAGRNCASVPRDHYGLCCMIRDAGGDTVLHSRDPRYPY